MPSVRLKVCDETSVTPLLKTAVYPAVSGLVSLTVNVSSVTESPENGPSVRSIVSVLTVGPGGETGVAGSCPLSGVNSRSAGAGPGPASSPVMP